MKQKKKESPCDNELYNCRPSGIADWLILHRFTLLGNSSLSTNKELLFDALPLLTTTCIHCDAHPLRENIIERYMRLYIARFDELWELKEGKKKVCRGTQNSRRGMWYTDYRISPVFYVSLLYYIHMKILVSLIIKYE